MHTQKLEEKRSFSKTALHWYVNLDILYIIVCFFLVQYMVSSVLS